MGRESVYVEHGVKDLDRRYAVAVDSDGEKEKG